MVREKSRDVCRVNPLRTLAATSAALFMWHGVGTALASNADTDAADSTRQHALVSPDARRYPAGQAFSHWVGGERVYEGELSPATPRAMAEASLLPALAVQPQTTAFIRGVYAGDLGDLAWRVLELGSMHEISGGSVLNANFRYDERHQRAVQGMLALTLPMAGLWLVPSVGLGREADFAPVFSFGNELRSSRDSVFGYSFGFDGSEWTDHRRRMLGKLGAVYRIGPSFVLEERISAGIWSGPDVDGDLALSWLSAARHPLVGALSLYERFTLSRGARWSSDEDLRHASAWGVDAALGVHYQAAPTWGVVFGLDYGTQFSHYQRFGVELTLVSTLF